MRMVSTGFAGAVTRTPSLLPGGMKSVSGVQVRQVGMPSSSMTWNVAPGMLSFQKPPADVFAICQNCVSPVRMSIFGW